jgi:creatinine amidohydrolase
MEGNKMERESSHALRRLLCCVIVISFYLGTGGALRSQPDLSNSGGIQLKAAESVKSIRMDEMTWPDIKSAIEQGYVTVVVAVGSTEQHGPHLPTMTDTRIGDELAHRVAIKLGHTLQAKTISVGCSAHHLAFPGTISLRDETLRMMILDYIDSLMSSGFNRIIFIPIHGGNFPTVQVTVKEAQMAHQGIEIIGVTDVTKLVACLNAASAEFGVTLNESGSHAGESETSLMMALEGNLVVKDRFAPGYVGLTREKELKIMREKGMHILTKNGVIGDPRKASADKGEIYLNRLTEFLIKEIKKQARSAAEPEARTTIQRFIGTWKLVTSEFRTSDGKVAYPLGEKAVGILMYDSGGRFAVQLMQLDRPKFASGDMRGGTPEEFKTAAEGYVAYFGTYEVDDKKGTVVHYVEASLFPNWLGREQIRFFDFSDDLLTLKTPPMLSGGQDISGVLVWKRLP